jgi:hypothetical protein
MSDENDQFEIDLDFSDSGEDDFLIPQPDLEPESPALADPEPQKIVLPRPSYPGVTPKEGREPGAPAGAGRYPAPVPVEEASDDEWDGIDEEPELVDEHALEQAPNASDDPPGLLFLKRLLARKVVVGGYQLTGKFIALAAAVLLGFVLVWSALPGGAGSPQVSEGIAGTVRGVFCDPAGSGQHCKTKPVEGATVWVASAPAQVDRRVFWTDANGALEISLKPGTYWLQVSGRGFKPANVIVRVEAGKATDPKLALRELR